MSVPTFDSPRLAAEYEIAAKTILCDCGCHPQSVHDCACGRAAEMRDEIAAIVRGGKSGEEVVASYVAKYGEKILVAPSAAGFNLVAWLGPGAALLVAALGLALVLRRWQRRHAALPAPAAAAPLDAAAADRLRRELEEYDR